MKYLITIQYNEYHGPNIPETREIITESIEADSANEAKEQMMNNYYSEYRQNMICLDIIKEK